VGRLAVPGNSRARTLQRHPTVPIRFNGQFFLIRQLFSYLSELRPLGAAHVLEHIYIAHFEVAAGISHILGRTGPETVSPRLLVWRAMCEVMLLVRLRSNVGTTNPGDVFLTFSSPAPPTPVAERLLPHRSTALVLLFQTVMAMFENTDVRLSSCCLGSA